MTKSRIKKSRKRMRSRAASMLLHHALTRQEGGGMRLVRMWAEAAQQRCERRRLMQLYNVAMLKIAASRRMFGMSPLQQAHYIARS